MKSRLRSRWYRPNEKPLETSSGDSKNQEPFGEISATNEKLVDDLTNAKPPQQSERGKGSQRKDKTSHENHNQRQNSRKPRNHNRDSRKKDGEKDHRDSTKQKDGSFSEKKSNERSNSNPKNRKPRRRKNKKRNEHQANEKRNVRSLEADKTKENKKSGISGFISKLFGS
jgi:hypothetical protein